MIVPGSTTRTPTGGTVPIITLPTIVSTFVPVVGDILGKLIGAPPRGQHQKFLRVAYPAMFAHAEGTGLPVMALWFNNEIVEVRPNGDYGVVARNIGSLASMTRFYEKEAAVRSFWSVACGADAPQTAEEFQANCTYTRWGKGNLEDDQILPGATRGERDADGGSVFGLVILGVIVAGLVLAVMLSRRKKS
jgi:hypothetical protein